LRIQAASPFRLHWTCADNETRAAAPLAMQLLQRTSKDQLAFPIRASIMMVMAGQ
jgi:hypothetical protein